MEEDIYHCLSSKSDIIDAVTERNYSHILDEGSELAASSRLGTFQKLEIIYHTCLDSSMELRRQGEIRTFNGQRKNTFIYQRFPHIIITKLKFILADIIHQRVRRDSIQCSFPEETAQAILAVLAITPDNHLILSDDMQIGRIPSAFTEMRERGMRIPSHTLQFLMRETRRATEDTAPVLSGTVSLSFFLFSNNLVAADQRFL